jgi:hypothetical protein
MADGSDTTLTAQQAAGEQAPNGLVSGIVLVGEDGAWADQFADDTVVARQACAKAGVTVENAWERELMDQMRPSNDLWRSMARRTMAR